MSHPPFGVLDREGVVHVLRRAHEAYADYDADQSDENYQKAIDAGEAYSRAVENYTSHQTPKPTPAPGAPPAPEEPAAVVPRRFRREGVGQPHPEWAAEMAAPAGQPPLVVGPDGKLMSSAHDTTPTARPLVVSPGDTRVYGESSPLEPPAAPAPGEPGWRLPKATAEAIFGRAPLEQAAEGAIADAVKTHPRPLPTIPQRRTMAREAGQPFRLGGPTGEQTVRAQTEEDVQGDLARAEAARGERVGEEVRANPEAAPWIFAREMGRHVVRGAGHRLPGLLRAVIRAAPQTPEAARAAGIPYVEPDVRGRLSEALDREIARGQAEESGAGPVGRQARELLPFLAALAPVEAAVPAVRAVSPAARLMERLLGGALRIGRTGAVVGGASGLETAATGGGPADVARATAGGFAVGAGFGVAGEAWGAAVQKVRSLLAGKDLATWAGPEEPLIHAARASGFRNGSPEQLDAAYATLGLDPETATAEQVKTARRTMAVRFAPRTQAQAADPLVSARMTTINAAHDAVVEDLARRRPVAPAPAPPPARPAEAPTAAAAPTPPRPAYPPPAAGETLQEWLAKLPPEARTAEAITSATEAIRAQGGGRVAPEARPAWEAAVEGYAAPAAPVPGDFRAAARPGDVAAVPEPQMPGRALHDVEGHPIPGTEQAIGLPAGQPERRTRPVNLPPVGMAERRAVPAPLITPEQLTQHGAAPAPAQITRMKVSDIEMDPARFQFRDVGPEGVTGELRGISKWNKYMGGVISVWRDPANGRVYVVNGHNRVDAARRLGVQELNVQFLDQPTAAEARSEGALINIGEGRATPLDVAKVMRDRKLTVEDINSRGISVRSELARAGGNLSRLAPDLFDQVAVGKISTSTGSAIGEAIPGDPALQREAMSIIRASGKRLTEAEAREVAAQVRDAATTDVTQQTLFGTETERVGLYVPKAQLVTALRRRLNADKRLFGYVSKEGRAEELARAGSTKVDVEAARQLATASSQVEELFNRLYRYSGPVSEQVTEGAGRIANGAKPAIVAADLYPAIFGAVQSEIARGGEVRGPGTAEPEVAAGAGAPSAAGEEEYPEGVVPDSTDPDQSALFERPKPYTPTPEDQQVLAQARSRLADLEAQLQAGWDRVQSRSQHAGDYMAGPFTEPGGADYNTLRDTWVNSPQYRALKAAIQRAGAEVKRLSTPKAPTRLKLSGRMMDLPTASAVTLPSDPYVRLDQISDSELAKMRQLVDWVDDPKQTEALSAEQVMTFRADRTALQNEINRRAGGVAERTKAYSPETVAQGNLFGSNEDITGPTGTRDLFPEDREIPGAAQTTEEAKATVLRKLKPGEAMGPRLGLTTGETEPAELPGERPLRLLDEQAPYTGTPAEDQLRAVQGALQKGEQTDAVRGATKRIDRALAGLAGEPDPLGDTPSSHIKNAMQVLSFADQLGEGTPEGKAALEQLRNALRDPRITPPHGVGEGGVAEQKEPLGATEYGGKPERAPLLPRMSYRAPKAGTAEAQQMELVFGNAAAHGQAAKLGLEANRVPTFDERRAVIPTGGRMSVDVVGKRIAGAQDIATVGRPFRSPQTETLGAMLAGDDDTVLHLETMTSGAIGHVDIPMERVGDALLPMPLARTIAARVNVTGATKVKLLHNHPSGNVKPSLEDRAITEKLDKALKHLGVKMEVEHYVIDHHTVSVIRIGKDGKAEVEENVAVEPPAGEARPDWTDVRGPELNTPSAVAAVAGHVPDHEMHVYYRDNAGRAVAMVPHRKSARGDIGTWLTREMHDVGAVGAIIVTPGNDAVLWRDLATDGRVAALGVLDVVGLDPRSGVYDSANARGLIGARPFGRGVGEATASYGGPGKPPVPLGRGAGEPVSGAGAGAGRPPEANPAELFSAVPAGEDLGDLARALGEETDPIKRRALIERVGRIYASIRKGRGPDPDINPTDYLNIERMDPADLNRPILEDEIRRSAERMYPEGRPAKGFNEALAEAQKIAADPRRLAGIPAERMSGTERLAERLLASAEIARHGGLLRRLADPTLRDAEREAIEQALAASDVRLHARIGRMMKAGTAQGRDLAYNRILANQTLDPATWLLRAQRVRGDVLTPAMREKILGMLERGEIDQLAQYVSQLREASTSRKIARYAKTNMISALTTIARIFTGSQFDLWMQLAGPGRLGELMADRVVRGMTKVETRSMLTGMRDVAIRQGAKQLVEEWGKIIRGEPVTGRSDVWGLGEFTNVPAEPMPGRMGQIHYKMMEALDTYEHAITRTHMGTHRLGWAPTYQKSLAEQSLLVARESLTVKGVRPKPSEPSVQQKARPLFAHPTDEMQNIAIEEARLATYLNRNAIADAVNALKRKLATAELPGRGMPAHAVNVGARALYLATEMTLPFAQISTNLIARGLETTPLGMATSGIAFGRLAAAVSHGLPKSEVEALQREFTRRAGRFTTGALLTLLGLYLYYRGRLIGYGPKDRGGKQAMRDQGASEFSIKIGDHWWSLSALGPLMMALGGAAAIGEVFDDPQLSGGKRALAAATGAIGVGARESLLRGLQTGAKAIGEPLTAGVQWAESAASAMIPAGNFLAKIAQASDPWQRRPHTFTQSIESRIPGARLAVPKATGRFGEPLPGTRTLGEVFSAIANPFLWRPDVTAGNPVLAEVARVKASVPTPKHRKGQSEDDYHEMLGRVGAAMLAKVQAEIASGEYGSASTEDQKYFLEREARAGEREVLRDVEADEPVKPTRQGERARRARTRRRR